MRERTINAGKIFAAAFVMILLFFIVPLFFHINAQSTGSDPKIQDIPVIHAYKKLNGRLTSRPFSFELKNQQGETLLTVENNAQGLVSFDLTSIPTLRWLVGDIYYFTLSEVIPENDDGIVRDKTVYRIELHVYESPYVSLIECFNEEGVKVDEIVFENSMDEPPVEPTPIVFYPILPETGFPAAKTKNLSLSNYPPPVYKPLKYTLQIPMLGLAAALVEVPVDPSSGRYDVSGLDHSVGVLSGYALPGEGNSILTGHNHLNSTEAGPFVDLLNLNEGDRVFLNDPSDTLTMYIVYANEKIAEDDFAALNRISSAFDRSLTFITCEDERTDGGYANRRIVAARPAD